MKALPSPGREVTPALSAKPGSGTLCWSPRGSSEGARSELPGRPAKLRRLAGIGCCAGSSALPAAAAAEQPAPPAVLVRMGTAKSPSASAGASGPATADWSSQGDIAVFGGAVPQASWLEQKALPGAHVPGLELRVAAGSPASTSGHGSLSQARLWASAHGPHAGSVGGAGRHADPVQNASKTPTITLPQDARAERALRPRGGGGRGRQHGRPTRSPPDLNPNTVSTAPGARASAASCSGSGWARRGGHREGEQGEPCEHAGVHYVPVPHPGSFAAPPVVTWSGAAVERHGEVRRPLRAKLLQKLVRQET